MIYRILSSTNWKALFIYSLSALSPTLSLIIWILSFNLERYFSKDYKDIFFPSSSYNYLCCRLNMDIILSTNLSSLFFYYSFFSCRANYAIRLFYFSALRITNSELSFKNDCSALNLFTYFCSFDKLSSIIFSILSNLTVIFSSKFFL
jgi:hypothetical protein